MAEISITLPDGSQRDVGDDSTVLTLATSISRNLGKAACLKEVASCKLNEREMRWGEIIKERADDKSTDKAHYGKREHVQTDFRLIELIVFGKNVRVLIVNEIEEECLCKDKSKADHKLYCVVRESLIE